MARGLNKVFLVGNIGRDPEIKDTATTKIAKLSLATTERRKSPEGEWEDYTEWHRLVAFGAKAEIIEKYCQKGRQIFVEGRITTRKWQDDSGADRYMTEIIVNDFLLLSGSDKPQQNYIKPQANGDLDDDIPF